MPSYIELSVDTTKAKVFKCSRLNKRLNLAESTVDTKMAKSSPLTHRKYSFVFWIAISTLF